MVWSKKNRACLLSIVLVMCLFTFPRFSEATSITGPEEIQEKIQEKKEEGKKESTFHIQNMEIQTLLKALAMKNGHEKPGKYCQHA